MNAGRKTARRVMGLGLMMVPLLIARTDPTPTNSPAARTAPPLPPLPPPLRLPINGQQQFSVTPYTNHPQLPQALRPGNTTGAAGTAPGGNLPPLPVAPPPAVRPAIVEHAAPISSLVADAEVKEYTAQAGETNAQFTFTLTNTAPHELTINDVRTSCGCTVAQLPSRPWVLAPGTNGQIHVTVDLRGKHGQITKMIYVYGTAGTKTLTVKVAISDAPAGLAGERGKNIQIATADRQAVFKNDCAKCHAEPAAGKKGEALYAAACAVCHDAAHRASMVPDLRALSHPTDRKQWQNWIAHGKSATLMPAFAAAEGGPLTDEQIDSLVEYLVEHFPWRPAAASAALPASR